MALKSTNLHIVDDDVELLDTTSRMLTKIGHVVRGETASLNALRTFSENPSDFDIAILDVRLADVTGLELAQRFRRIQPGFPVIFYGGDITSSLLTFCHKDGTGWYQKPATANELERAIREVLKR